MKRRKKLGLIGTIGFGLLLMIPSESKAAEVLINNENTNVEYNLIINDKDNKTYQNPPLAMSEESKDQVGSGEDETGDQPSTNPDDNEVELEKLKTNALNEVVESADSETEGFLIQIKERIANAKSKEEIDSILAEVRQNKQENDAYAKLKEMINNGISKINKLENLSDEQKKDFLNQISKAKDEKEINEILSRAKEVKNEKENDKNLDDNKELENKDKNNYPLNQNAPKDNKEVEKNETVKEAEEEKNNKNPEKENPIKNKNTDKKDSKNKKRYKKTNTSKKRIQKRKC